MTYQNCPVGRYHDFTVIASPYAERKKSALFSVTHIERCKLCNQSESYTVAELNSRRYFLNHIRDFAQPGTDDAEMQKAFDYCKPKAAQRFTKEAEDKKKLEDKNAERSDKFKFAIKRALNNESWDGIDKSSKDRW